MSFKIQLAILNGRGACQLAAKRLRILAKRFDKLAECHDPYNGTTQNKINKGFK